jgi:hypothetical protein
LGDIQAAVKRPPPDPFVTADSMIINQNPDDVWLWISNLVPLGPGRHEVRWYGTRGQAKYQEIARRKFDIDAHGNLQMGS